MNGTMVRVANSNTRLTHAQAGTAMVEMIRRSALPGKSQRAQTEGGQDGGGGPWGDQVEAHRGFPQQRT